MKSSYTFSEDTSAVFPSPVLDNGVLRGWLNSDDVPSYDLHSSHLWNQINFKDFISLKFCYSNAYFFLLLLPLENNQKVQCDQSSATETDFKK